MKILVVDDHEEARYQLKVLLEGQGHRVVPASNGAEALESARRDPPDLIVSDILMPVMDGFSLCREWKKDGRLRPIPFVFYTATYTDDRDREFALGLGAEAFIVKPEEPEAFLRTLAEVVGRTRGSSPRLETPVPPSEEVFLRQYNQALVRKLEDKILDLEREMADRRRAEEEAERLREQLRQTQKLEAIGRLAAGVAHDFNNLLTVIRGYSEVLLSRIRPDDPAREAAEEIARAGECAASLARQLLAFGRRQVLKPRVFRLDTMLSEMEGMLRRLISEDIELVFRFGADLGAVRADPCQMEQVILNLAANARDAMPRGGRLVLEALNVDLDREAVFGGATLPPGRYVELSVADTGLGMGEEVRSHLFEPFYTTKEAGKGTGLGLSVVYGIVRQSGGHVWVESEPGKGTTFRLLLPRAEAAPGEAPAPAPPGAGPLRGTETVLLVEDAEPIRLLAREALQSAGYKVMEAPDGKAALERAAAGGRAIDLLVTDLIMPGMTGRELATRLAEAHPGLRVLYVSGYSEDMVSPPGGEGSQGAFLSKPFTPGELLRRVREILDSKT